MSPHDALYLLKLSPRHMRCWQLQLGLAADDAGDRRPLRVRAVLRVRDGQSAREDRQTRRLARRGVGGPRRLHAAQHGPVAGRVRRPAGYQGTVVRWVSVRVCVLFWAKEDVPCRASCLWTKKTFFSFGRVSYEPEFILDPSGFELIVDPNDAPSALHATDARPHSFINLNQLLRV